MGRPQSGKLRIGDEWNAIVLLARTQTNPLKAVAELVENSLDARARRVSIVRGRHRGKTYLTVLDDGQGVRLGEDGRPDFRYVATHICDSIKRHLTEGERTGVHGEFGIGLLGFWAVGEVLRFSSRGSDGGLYEMVMRAGSPKYSIHPSRGRLPLPGVEVTVTPVRDTAKRTLSGERLERYLAEELRDRIRSTGVLIEIVDKVSRKRLTVKPKAFQGERVELTREIAVPEAAPVRVDLYYRVPAEGEPLDVGVFRDGTRVAGRIQDLDDFNRPPWTLNRLEGLVDFPGLNVSPATRSGVVPDAMLARFIEAVRSIEPAVVAFLETRERAEEQKASENLLKDVQRALAEALRQLEEHEYELFEVGRAAKEEQAETPGGGERDRRQVEIFEVGPPGPLTQVCVVPARARIAPGETRRLVARAMDEQRRSIDAGVAYVWEVESGPVRIAGAEGPQAEVHAPNEHGAAVIGVTASQEGIEVRAKATISVEERSPLLGEGGEGRRGLPGYRLIQAAGQPWRSRYDAGANVIDINAGHRDYAAARGKLRSLRRYIAKLYAKEIVLLNFPGYAPGAILDRMVELLTRMEDRL
ncbi:MAG: ATP-binding protein [Nitrospirae bacterium]|nr:ATP-binding protein [Nitrospirota bacterium]